MQKWYRRLKGLLDKCVKLLINPDMITSNPYGTLNILNFDDTYTYFCLIRFYKYYKLELNENFALRASSLRINHDYSTRSVNNHNLNLPSHRLSLINKSFFKNSIKR